jgi:hypothetical protein
MILNSKIIYPLNDEIGSVALIQHAGDDKMVVNAAYKLCDGQCGIF